MLHPCLFVRPCPYALREIRPAPRKSSSSAVSTPVRFLCLKNLADMLEREGEDERALELHVAAAEEDATDLAVRKAMNGRGCRGGGGEAKTCSGERLRRPSR